MTDQTTISCPIPRDIRKAAWAAWEEGENDHGARVHHIELAILAERERCAKVAEGFGRTGREWVPDSLWYNIKRETAAAIRALDCFPEIKP